jgi:hypothetical protein
MNAQKISKIGIGLSLGALALSGMLAVTVSCAGGGDGGSGGGGGGQGGGGQGGGGQGGGTPGTCDPAASGNATNFCNGRAQGLFKGWGWVALGALDTITDPTCDTGKAAITKAVPCTTTTNWSTNNDLCISGSIPALPASPVQKDYDDNWGVQIGLNSDEPPAASGGATIGLSSASAVNFTVSGTPATGLRAMLHRKGDSDDTTYCANMTSGVKISITAFNTKCWDGSGTGLTTSDLPNLDKAGVQVSSTASPITVTNLCLKSIVFE